MAHQTSGAELPPDLRPGPDAETDQLVAADATGKPYLVWRTVGGEYGVHVLSKPGRVTIGRRETSDIVLADDSVASRTHAELMPIGSDWMLVDDGLSTNGTFVGGVEISGRRRLTHGDLVRCGKTLLQYRAADAGSSSLTALEDRAERVTRVTGRQLDVLIALARPRLLGGRDVPTASNKEVAAELFLSVASVKEHLRNLFNLFGIANERSHQKRERLADLAADHGLISKRDL